MSDDRCELLCLDLPRAEKLRKERLGRRRADELAAGAKALGDFDRNIQRSLLVERSVFVDDLA